MENKVITQRHGEKYGLKPSAEQVEQFKHYFEGSRAVYNHMTWIQTRIRSNISDFYRLKGLARLCSYSAFLHLHILHMIFFCKPKKEDKKKPEFKHVEDIYQGYRYLDRDDLSRLLTRLIKQENFKWLQSIGRDTLRGASDNVANAIKAYKKRFAKFPKHKPKSDQASFLINCGGEEGARKHFIKEDGRDYFLLKIKKKGTLKIPYTQHRKPRPFSGGDVVISRRANTYSISFSTVQDKNVWIKDKDKRRIVGVDRNTKKLFALDDIYRGKCNVFEISKDPKGVLITNKLTRRLKILQKDLSRKYQPNKKQYEQSNNYKKNKLAIQKIHLKIANLRKDRSHFISAQVARKYDHVVIEDLKLKNMTRSAKGTIEAPGKNVKAKSGLNRTILNANLGQVSQFLAYKLSYSGKILEKVPPMNTSITCRNPKCPDPVNKENRKGDLFKCVACGYNNNADLNEAIDADFNAAGNIKDKSCL